MSIVHTYGGSGGFVIGQLSSEENLAAMAVDVNGNVLVADMSTETPQHSCGVESCTGLKTITEVLSPALTRSSC